MLADLLGSAVGIAEDGIVNADLTWFGDFGNTLSAPSWDTVTSFTGHVETAGLVEFATRTYDAATRVWVQEDTFTGTVTRASSLNRYAYVEGSPVSHTDVLGAFRAASAMAAQKLSAADYAAFMAQLTVLAVAPVCVAPGVNGFGFPGADAGLGTFDLFGDVAGYSVLDSSAQARLFGAGESNQMWRYSPKSNPGSVDVTFNQFGRTRFGGVVRQLGPVGDVVGIGLDYTGNYYGEFSTVQDEQERRELSAERTFVTSGTGIATGLLGAAAVSALCGPGAPVCFLIGGAGVLIVSWVASVRAGDVWDSANADRVADATTPQSAPAAPPVPTVIAPITAPPAQSGPPAPYEPTITILQTAAS